MFLANFLFNFIYDFSRCLVCIDTLEEKASLVLIIVITNGNSKQTNSNSKHYLQQSYLESVFNKLSNDTQVNRLCTCDSLVVVVSSSKKFWNLKMFISQIFRYRKG